MDSITIPQRGHHGTELHFLIQRFSLEASAFEQALHQKWRILGGILSTQITFHNLVEVEKEEDAAELETNIAEDKASL